MYFLRSICDSKLQWLPNCPSSERCTRHAPLAVLGSTWDGQWMLRHGGNASGRCRGVVWDPRFASWRMTRMTSRWNDAIIFPLGSKFDLSIVIHHFFHCSMSEIFPLSSHMILGVSHMGLCWLWKWGPMIADGYAHDCIIYTYDICIHICLHIL